MPLSPRRMYDALLASDDAYDGRFWVGVRTTGIYCRPSCHARKPRFENLRFAASGGAGGRGLSALQEVPS